MGTETVLGEKYRSVTIGISARGGTYTHVYIPSHKLDLNEEGHIYVTDGRLGTEAGDKAAKELLKKMNRDPNLRRLSGSEQDQMLDDVRAQADLSAIQTIMVPKEFADRIKSMQEESVNDNTTLGRSRALQEELKRLVLGCGLFE